VGDAIDVEAAAVILLPLTAGANLKTRIY